MIRIWFKDYDADRSGGPRASDRKIKITGPAQFEIDAAYARGFFVVPYELGTLGSIKQEFIPWHAVFSITEEK